MKVPATKCILNQVKRHVSSFNLAASTPHLDALCKEVLDAVKGL